MKLLVVGLIAAILATCQTNTSTVDTILSVTVPAAEATVLKFTIKDDAKRTALANLLTFYANTAVRATSGNPTPEQFVQNLHTFIPQNIRDEYAEFLPMADSLVLMGYNAIYAKYQNDIQGLYTQVGVLANAIAEGAAPYISH